MGYSYALTPGTQARSLPGMYPATERQLMVLRFWDRMDLAELGKEAVSDWLDAWQPNGYNPGDDNRGLRRYCAWQLFKREHPETKLEEIERGCGPHYVEKMRQLEEIHGIDALEFMRYGDMP